MLVAQFPSRRLKRSSRSPALPRIARTCLSRGSESPAKFCMQPRSRLVGLRHARLASACFHAALSLRSGYRSPEQFVQVHPSLALLLLRVPSLKSPALCLSTRTLDSARRPRPLPKEWARAHSRALVHLPRVSSLIAASPERVHFPRRLPSLRFVPSSGFLSPTTVSSALRLCELVSSRSHVQGSCRSGASLPAQRRSLIESPCPPAVGFRALTGRPAARFRAPPASGCHARETSTSRPFSARGSVAFGSGSTSPTLAPLFGFRLLQVFNCCLRLWFPRASAHDGSFRGCSRSSPWAVLSVLSATA
jgi:hypothetical protein